VDAPPRPLAPVERAASEARFYRLAAKDLVLAKMMPRLLDYDERSALLVLEDLAPAATLADCYEGTTSLEKAQLQTLARYTSTLHRMAIPLHERHFFRNEAMRKLNHEHIFDVPLRTDGALSEMLERITPGLDSAGEKFRHEREFCETVGALGRRYLEYEGASLIHGDLFPGSLLRIGSGELLVKKDGTYTTKDEEAVGSSLLYAFLGMASLGIGFWVFDRLTPYALWTEVVEQKNIALAIVVAGFAIAIGLIVSSAIR
jgi:5-methylthioribose kinase